MLHTVTELTPPDINPLSFLCQGSEVPTSGWRNCMVKKIRQEGSPFHHQVQYHTRFAPMIIKEWTLPLFMKAGLQPATTAITIRTDIECACC
eukprot:1139348-Pelagomonas_calceolata.AAC.2